MRQNIQEQEKKRRDSLIGKLKKEHIATLNTEYLSKTLPLEESRVHFREAETEMAEYFRNAKGREPQFLKKKCSKKMRVRGDESPRSPKRRENKMPTVFKKKKAFIDKIDPTSSSFRNTLKTEAQQHVKRGSVFLG
jgi:hypothetical protein